MFTGYIDESGDDKTKLFTLSCLVSDSTQWELFENTWLDCLKRKNAELRIAGRKEMSRYHASSCASCIDEFKGWTIPEQKEFTSALIGVFKQYGLAISAYTLSLDDLVAEFPEAENNPIALAYVITFNEIMILLAQKLLEMPAYREDRLAFIHDRCDYDTVLLRTFDYMKDCSDLKNRDRFATVAPMGWEDCVPLQPADLIAYQNFKIVERDSIGKPMPKCIELILDLDSIRGRGVKLERLFFKSLREQLDKESVNALFINAGLKHT